MLDWQLRECYKIKEGKKTEEQEIQTFILGFSQYLGSKIIRLIAEKRYWKDETKMTNVEFS